MSLKINVIKEDGVNIVQLDGLIGVLKEHVKDISDVEDHIDAIKNEVISPIAEDLKDNKIAGKFSIWGFYVGAFGLLASVVSLLYTTFYVNADNNKAISCSNIDSIKNVSCSNSGNIKAISCLNAKSAKYTKK